MIPRPRPGPALVLATALLTAGCLAPGGSPNVGPDTPRIALTPVVTGLDQPVHALSADDGSGRLFIVEQTGRVRIWQGDHLLGDPFLDLQDEVSTGFEQGLLGLAFPPNLEESQRVYVSYTDTEGTSKLVRYKVDPTDRNRVLPESREELLSLHQPYPNHNGGHTAFGPDGHLYHSLGDGGDAHDPLATGQDPTDLYGSILRLNVSTAWGTGYRVPADNPYVGERGRDEVWAIGLRNPWRFTFDPATGGLWIGDVGQDAWEEVDHAPGNPGGMNYGWSVWEGNERFDGGNDETTSNATFPVATYPTGKRGCSVVMGPVVRDAGLPALEGRAIYGDFCTGIVWSIAPDGKPRIELDTRYKITSFDVGPDGRVLLTTHGGTVARVRSSTQPNP